MLGRTALAFGLASLVARVNADVAVYDQCGGLYYTGSTKCNVGSACTFSNPYYSQCLPVPGANPGVPVYSQCGGLYYTGSTHCQAGSTCVYSNPYYSQCLPSPSTTSTTHKTTSTSKTSSTTSKSTSTTSTSTKVSTSTKPSTTSTSTTSTTSSVTTITTTTTSSSAPSQTGLRGLNLLAGAHGRYFGTSTDGLWSNNDTAYLALSGNFSEFGISTPGNALKWDTIEPSQNVFAFDHGDFEVQWHRNHSQVVRGHNFVWYSQLPTWVSNGGFDNATLLAVLKNHIYTEAGHYYGQVRSWDVINEPWNDDGTYQSNIWYNTIGPAFIPIALGYAHTADPNAKLYINDYNMEWQGPKSDAMYNLTVSLLAQGAPLHGVGFEGHLILNEFYRTFVPNFQRFGALGIEFAITELDIRFDLPANDTLLAQQAENYAYVVNSCLAVPACIGITTWDTSDDYSWIPGVFAGQGDALLFDSNKQPKPAYYAVADALAAATVQGQYTKWVSPPPPSTTTSAPTQTATSSVTTTITTTTASAAPTALRGLNLLAGAHGRYFGTSTDGLWSNNDTAYLALSGNSSEFGISTPGNALKWDTTEPSQNVFAFAHGDFEVQWHLNHSQVVRGHNFVWYSQLPTWVSNGGFDNATLLAVLKNHIDTEAGHYYGQLRSWDVINEPWNDDGTYQSNIWYNTIGPAFIPIALGYAHAADPNAKLYINDYNMEWQGPKSDAMYNLTVSLLAQGAPLHGVGFEGHLILNEFYRTFVPNFQRFGALGIEFAITELDIRFDLPANDTLLAQQAENYAYVVNSCLAVPACIGITTWDTSDDYSWIPGVFAGQGAALLFDSNKKPKPAYYAVADALAAATVQGQYTKWVPPPPPSTTTSAPTQTATSSVTTTITTTTASATPTALRGLNLLALTHGRYFGTSTDGLWSNNDTAYLALSGNSSEFGISTPGNALKWDTTEPSQNVFDFAHGDFEVQWHRNHSQVVRGHNFVWYSQLPTWVSGGGFDNATLIAVLKNHIDTEAGRYVGQLRSWDVINEPWNDDGTYQSNIWYNTIGPAFIPIALGFAHAADPKAKLYINDYNMEWQGPKSDAMYNLTVSLLAQGAPLHGIGFEGHLILNQFYRTFVPNFQRFDALGIEFAITELDIRFQLPATDSLLAAQAENYAYVVNSCLAVSSCIGITTWDTSDDYSWIPGVFTGYGDALLFDSNKHPKPAYYSVADALAAATVKGNYAGWP